MSDNGSKVDLTKIAAMTKKAPRGKAIQSVARSCREQANQRFRKKLGNLVKSLEKQNCQISYWIRPTSDADSTYWPPWEIAIGVSMLDLKKDEANIEVALEASRELLGTYWQFTVVPVLGGVVLADFAMRASFNMASESSSSLPVQDFAMEWQEFIDLPFHVSEIASAFDSAMNACAVLSAMVNCRNLKELHPEEQKVSENCINDFKAGQELLGEAVEKTSLEVFEFAFDVANDTWNKVVEELNTVEEGNVVSNPVYEWSYMALDGKECEFINEMGAARMLLRQAEIQIQREKQNSANESQSSS